MKKIISLLLIFTLTLSLTACGSAAPGGEASSDHGTETSTNPSDTSKESASPDDEEETAASPEETTDEAASSDTEVSSNILIAYFSWADNAILADDVDAVASPSVIAPGNVQQLAGWVQEKTDGDLFSIQVTESYPSDWDACLARANQERSDDARPELTANVENPEQYDVIFLGYPNWWYGVPMALLSFLESNDFSGKQIYLFCSHGTGGLANSVNLITDALPDSEISDNIFDCYEEDAPDSQEEIENWLTELGY